MKSCSGRGDFISAKKLARLTALRISSLKRVYSELCSSGTSSEAAAFFADNFHAVISPHYSKSSGERNARIIYFPGKYPLAEKLIDISGERFAKSEEIILAFSSEAGKRRIFGAETEFLKSGTVCALIERICQCVKNWDKGLIRYMSLLRDIGSVDFEKINDVLNPVAIKLSADRAYSLSDRRTRFTYREAVYLTAEKYRIDEIKLTEKLLEKYRGEDVDIVCLEVLGKSERKAGAALWAASGLIISAAATAFLISYFAGAPLAGALLFLPAIEALRPISDFILTRRRSVRRLMRLDPSCEEVKAVKAVAVISSAVSGPEDADGIYDRLLRLHCSEAGENIFISALIDLPPEQVPITSEDRAVIESLSEAIKNLDKIAPGRFSCFIRKRSFSETQQEYMGKERKRGALKELAKYICTGEGDFYACLGGAENIVGSEYICACDSDTRPLMDSVQELLSIALHPANKVKIVNKTVVSGYGIIAPRMVTRLKDSLSSEFSKSLGGIGSLSSYDEESSNLYQDVFGRGTFCGKGLISAKALHECLDSLEGERILSHDILEGEILKTAYAGDVVFTEGFPRTPQSYYRRLDRWIRGDFQNIPEIFSPRFDALSKLKLLDNLRRAITPVSVFLSFPAGFLIGQPAAGAIALAALGLWLLPSCLGTLGAVFSDRAPGRRFYSGLLSSASQSLRYIFYSVVMLPTLAVKSLRAMLTAAWRLITKRKLLEWTTADAQDRTVRNSFAYYLLPELLGLSLLWCRDGLIRLFGAVFSAMPALLAANGGEQAEDLKPKYRDLREISKQTADMWGFFENYVTRLDNFLPPDNVQFSPVYRIAHRTSPTNIGLYLLSALAAYDRKLISREALLSKLEDSVLSIERLEKYKGNLYNWYDTKTLKVCPPAYVSSVDSGNFVCCLVALKEGLKELDGAKAKSLCERVENLIGSTDLSTFFDPVRGLMAIGVDPETGETGGAHYDFLMSEARLTSFWAIASRQVPKSHWQRLSRAMLRSGFFGGAASYSGTMFEYFMPELFLRSPEGSLFSESLKYALWVQKNYAAGLKRPYGISESGCYSFDPALNYRYMAHGVPKTGIRRGLENSYVVSPYSTYISLCFSPSGGAENLRKLSDYGMYGSYGLYEALDFSSPDSRGRPEPVRSYMAHHVGMSIIGCDNLLSGGIMQLRFMRDLRVRGALELLDERFHLGTAVFENALRRPRLSAPEPLKPLTETFSATDIFSPRVRLLSNGEATLSITDGGVTVFSCRSKNVYLRTRDPLSRPKGVCSFVSDSGDALPFGTFGGISQNITSEFSEDGAAFYLNTEKLSAGMKIALHSDYPCEIRRFALKNETAEPLGVSVINYIEPSLETTSAEESHPAFSKMFLRFERDPEWDVVTVTRINSDRKIFLGIGFIEDVKQVSSFDRGEVLEHPDGVFGLVKRFRDVSPSLVSEPDPCVFIRAKLELPPKAETEISLFLICADSKEELINRVSTLRRRRPKYSLLPRLDTASGRVASAILPDILYRTGMSAEKKRAVEKNRLVLNSLWELSLPTELPIVLVALNSKNDAQKLSAYLGAYKLLRRCGYELSLVFLFDDGGRYEREHYSDLIAAAREEGLESSVYSSGGILPVDIKKTRPELITLLYAAACHICADEIAPVKESAEPCKIINILPSKPIKQEVEREIACGGFSGESYVINERPPLPWCHVLSNSVFGTLLSENSLGFTYSFNSRENRITPWDNDPARDNLGERLILKSGGKYYDLVSGSAAVFSPCKAEYFSCGEGYKAKISVGVSEKGMCKKISLDITAHGEAEIIYYTEPCLGATRECCDMIFPERRDGGLLLRSACTAGFAYISSSEDCRIITDRKRLFGGNLEECVEPSPGLCGAIVCRISGQKRLDFYLSYALSEAAAVKMPGLYKPQREENPLKFSTNDPSLDLLINCWLPYQALHARIYARTGFYQCSGAYGFRDQLQDACGIAVLRPDVLKAQILRCCMAQFIQGDVLHWWHSLPNQKTRGIRTRISDDALWLPYAVCEYVEKTGDRSLLGLKAAYCEGLSLSRSEREKYGEVYRTSCRETVYEHCRRSIDQSAGKTGKNGLMLIGSGDWNDGFGSVGKDGEGESVWLTEFYIIVLRRFSKLALEAGDRLYSETLIKYADALSESVETSGRDGGWYLRGYFDSGEKLGSKKSPECKIDSIAQSFAEFADLGRDGFARLSLENAFSELCDIKRGVIKLFAPPFSDSADPDPGYIKFYPDGLRENGGQYTHAAIWLGMACLKAGMTKEGEEILLSLSPVRRSENGGHKKYRTEPYYICGDVYSNKNCFGRGGWSIYTGSAAWYYRSLTEGLFGLKFSGGKLSKDPRAPRFSQISFGGKPV